MLAKVLKGRGRGSGFRLFDNVKDVDVSDMVEYHRDSEILQDVMIFSDNWNDHILKGRMFEISYTDGSEGDKFFCDTEVFFCNDSGNTTDRVLCYERGN